MEQYLVDIPLHRPKRTISILMKSIFVLLIAVAPSMCFSQSLDNKTVIERLFLEGWNHKEFGGFRDQVSDSVHFHYHNQEFYTTVDELEKLVDMWHNAFENFRFEILQIVGEGDIVAVNLRYSGRHVNEFMGIQPAQKEISISEMMFFRFEEGKLEEAWEVYDQLGMLNQMQGNN